MISKDTHFYIAFYKEPKSFDFINENLKLINEFVIENSVIS